MNELSTALREIAEEIDKIAQSELANTPPDALRLALRSYAIALKSLSVISNPSTFTDPRSHQREMIERAKVEFRKKEEGNDCMIVCADGPCEGVSVLLGSDIPVGAFTVVEGYRYKLGGDGQLRLDLEP